MEKKSKKKNVLVIIGNILGNIIYYLVLIPLVIITISVIYQHTKEPDRIPDVLGWKIFMVMDERMYEGIDYGDLIFTKNVDTNTLKVGDVIAFRNEGDTITIHKIVEVNNRSLLNNITHQEEQIKVFTMKTQANEVESNKYVKDSQVEGILKNSIPMVGLIMMYVQQPIVLFIIICIVLIIGLICLYIAQQLDKRDEKQFGNNNDNNNNQNVKKIDFDTNEKTKDKIKGKAREKPKLDKARDKPETKEESNEKE